MKKRLIGLVKLIVLVAILFWLASTFPRENLEALRDQPKDWGLLGAALTLILAANVTSFLRWRILVRALGVDFSMVDAIRLGFLGALFNLISAGSVGGDLFKAIAAARQATEKRPEVISSVLIDRAMGLLGLVVVAALSLQFLPKEGLSEQLEWIRRGAWILSACGIAGFLGITLWGSWLPFRWLNRIPWIGHAIYRMAKAGLIFEGRPKLLATMFWVSLLVHFLLTLGTYSISSSLYRDRPSLSNHFLVVPPALAAGALPLTPGGLGVQEMAIQKLFEQIPEVPEHFSGLVTAAMYRLMTFVVAGIGAIFYFTAPSEVKRLRRVLPEDPAGSGKLKTDQLS